MDDRLPGLPLLRASGWRFDLILLVGVWQHLPPGTHREGMHALSTLLAAGGRLILSVRHGPGAPGRPCFPAEVGRLCRFAEAEGFRPESPRAVESVQQANRDAGVTWTWLAFDVP